MSTSAVAITGRPEEISYRLETCPGTDKQQAQSFLERFSSPTRYCPDCDCHISLTFGGKMRRHARLQPVSS
jgi:hypothetical protein